MVYLPQGLYSKTRAIAFINCLWEASCWHLTLFIYTFPVNKDVDTALFKRVLIKVLFLEWMYFSITQRKMLRICNGGAMGRAKDDMESLGTDNCLSLIVMLKYYFIYQIRASIHKAVRRLTAISREVSKQRTLCLIALKFEKRIGSSAAEIPVKLQSETMIITSNLAASTLHEIWD